MTALHHQTPLQGTGAPEDTTDVVGASVPSAPQPSPTVLACLGPSTPLPVVAAALAAIGRLVAGDLATVRPEAYALVLSPDAASIQRVELLVHELQRDGLRRLARDVRRRARAGHVLVLLVADDAPELRVLPISEMRRRVATGGPAL